jgi:hypothetical protein
VAVARVSVPSRLPPTLALQDLVLARRARAAVGAARAVIYSTTTAALLWPRPGAIRFDALSAANRPGRHGVWQRPVERRRLRSAPLLLPWSDGALRENGPPAAPSLVVPVPVAPGEPSSARDLAALTYGTNPAKKGLDRVLGRGRWRGGQTRRWSSSAGRAWTRPACAGSRSQRRWSGARCCAAHGST